MSSFVGSDQVTGLGLVLDISRTVAQLPEEPVSIENPFAEPARPPGVFKASRMVSVERACSSIAFRLTRNFAQAYDSRHVPRAQTNAVTSFLDLHTLYGSSVALTAVLRTHSRGLLRSVQTPDGELFELVGKDPVPELRELQAPSVPFAAVGGGDVQAHAMSASAEREQLFLTGDVRASQQPMIQVYMTLWLREHNRLARLLSAQHPDWSDETLFQEARRHVLALYQHYIEAEYWPHVLGPDFALPEYQGYRADLDPALDLMFAAVAGRVGHTQVSDVTLLHGDGSVYSAAGGPSAGG
jgi:hypothetical protein